MGWVWFHAWRARCHGKGWRWGDNWQWPCPVSSLSSLIQFGFFGFCHGLTIVIGIVHLVELVERFDHAKKIMFIDSQSSSHLNNIFIFEQMVPIQWNKWTYLKINVFRSGFVWWPTNIKIFEVEGLNELYKINAFDHYGRLRSRPTKARPDGTG